MEWFRQIDRSKHHLSKSTVFTHQNTVFCANLKGIYLKGRRGYIPSPLNQQTNVNGKNLSKKRGGGLLDGFSDWCFWSCPLMHVSIYLSHTHPSHPQKPILHIAYWILNIAKSILTPGSPMKSFFLTPRSETWMVSAFSGRSSKTQMTMCRSNHFSY